MTPDSFSDGGASGDTESAVAAGLAIWASGADIVDVGGESTRPGAEPVGLGEEIERVVPVVADLAAAGAVVSIDTMKPEVAAAAVAAGAELVNDVSGLRDPAMVATVAALDAGVVIMHMRGEPRTMQSAPEYGDVVDDVLRYLDGQARLAEAAGIHQDQIAIDPGIGFGKTHLQNLELLNRAADFISLGFPVLIGASRKGFLGTVLEAAGRKTVAAERDAATSATVAAAVIAGAAVIRVHDVARAVDVARTTDAIVRGQFEDRDSIGGT